jgi:mono/diheme cytochrome c family protein
MPNFHLSDREASDLNAFLSAQKANGPATNRFQLRPLTAFAQRKAMLLLTEKLSCLGCHQFGERGGRIGPNLTDVAARRQPGYIFDIIRDPRSAAPHSIMPRLPLTPETAELLANFLLQQSPSLISNTYLSALDHPIVAHEVNTGATPSGIAGARKNYLTYCAGCHGGEGHGDGFNAAFLPTRPTAHADARYLASRPDDTLFDGIHAGGAVLNKSHFMPAWGGTLSANEIRELVAHLRTLCRCSGPAWSKDDSPKP